MISILVSELTPELIEKSEWWAITTPARITPPFWKDTRHMEDFGRGSNGSLTTRGGMEVYGQDYRCFPVTLSPDGTETRLECPRMPDEPLIEEWSDTVETTATLRGMTSTVDDRLRWRLEVSGIPLTYWTLPPTPKHYPRRTCDGVWVWSTRR